MNKLFLFFIPLLLLFSCITSNEKKGATPDYLISRDSMVLIITDLQLIESIIKQKQLRGDHPKEIRDSLFKELFLKYRVSKARFDSSQAFYQSEPEIYDEIYSEVITKLNKIQSENKEEQKAEIR